MTRLVETWVANQFEAPFKCSVKVAFMSGSDGEYDVVALKTEMKTKIHNILLFIETKVDAAANSTTRLAGLSCMPGDNKLQHQKQCRENHHTHGTTGL